MLKLADNAVAAMKGVGKFDKKSN